MTATVPRVVVHDYSGHPGQAQLSRALARRGYEVTHQHCPSYATGKGSLELEPGDPESLRFEACAMDTEFNRYSFFSRIRQEMAYGRKAGRLIAESKPHVAVLSNVPLIAHSILARYLKRRRIPMVFWHQDIYSDAIGSAARKRFPLLGRPIAHVADRVERAIARKSAGIVAISPTFIDKLREWGVADKAVVVPNWAPIAELPVRPRRNPWSERMGLSDHPVVLYSGTLGLKHDPSILALMADELKTSRPDARVVVISEGKGREWLEQWKREYRADNLVLLDFQPYEDLPDVLATADVLVAILEPDASRFSVPSKVLTYLCSNRAILGVIPPANSVAEVLMANQAGHVVDPADRPMIAARVVEMLNDDELRLVMGKAGRRYAETEFSADRAADRFIEVFDARLAVPHPPLPEGVTVAAPARHAHASTTHHRRRRRRLVAAAGGVVAALLLFLGLTPGTGPARSAQDAASRTSSDVQSLVPSAPAPTNAGPAPAASAQNSRPAAAHDTAEVVTAPLATVAAVTTATDPVPTAAAAGTTTTAPSSAPPAQVTAPAATPPAAPANPVGSVVQVADQVVASAGSAVSSTLPQAAPITSVLGSLVSPSP